MLALLLLAVLSEWIQPGVITQAVSSLTVHPERAYKEAPTSFFAQLFITLFRFGTMAMAMCLCVPQSETFSFVNFAAIFGIIFGVAIVKMVCTLLLEYTFQISRRYGEMYEHYSNILTLVCMVLYGLLLVFMRIDSLPASRWLLALMAAAFLLLWLYRSARQYVHSPAALLYLLIYLVTLELLPMAGIAFLSVKTISII